VVAIGAARHACRHVAPLGAAAILLAVTPAFAGEGPALRVSNAWVPVSDRQGVDVPLLMTIRNEATEADALLRVSCPAANFSEKHTVDRGEGAPAMRAIKSIPVPAAGEITLKPEAYHVMLLQTRQVLAEGDTFSCSLVFQRAGKLETEVHVNRPK
jgi:periplasmic copper chaperone A